MHAFSLLTTFARDAQCYSNKFFQFPHWYEYLDVNVDGTTGVCQVSKFTFPGDITLIILAFLDMALYLASLVAIGFVVYGAITYVISQGEPDKTKKAQETVINALIGLVIALLASGIVRFIGARIGV